MTAGLPRGGTTEWALRYRWTDGHLTYQRLTVDGDSYRLRALDRLDNERRRAVALHDPVVIDLLRCHVERGDWTQVPAVEVATK